MTSPTPYRLLVITPCRDEARFLPALIQSVVQQSQRPIAWILVDDGSRDESFALMTEAAGQHAWIRAIRRQRPGPRQLGPGVVHAFHYGLAAADVDYDVIAKLDADLEFGPDCFAAILKHFDDPRVGMASGTTLLKVDGRLVSERYAAYHVPGQAKFYRRGCFAAIGGLQPVYGWDILDETDARRHGWLTLSDPSIVLIHHRLQGSSFGAVRGRMIWGRGAYAIGSHPFFALARGIFRMFERPWLIGGLAFLWGFFSSYFDPSLQRVQDQELIHYLRREQLYRLLHGNKLPPLRLKHAR
ncbi:MAG: glycosyltransferase family 2 protein [Desulfobacca sp.]|uniref:glycosyltransferase family 2 protein n=1 Tax=Desulfobacca sp. TaxID=2067990 RepID=UPI00404B7516